MPERNLEAILKVRNEADCLANESEVQDAMGRMAQNITARLSDSNPLVYVVMNGGLILAGGLLPRLPFALELSYLHATRYGLAVQGEAQLIWHVPPMVSPQGRTVLLLDDVLDEGHTLAAIIDRLCDEGAQTVLSAVLVNKRHERKVRAGMRANFTGFELEDRFLFGCGMDYQGYWRNLGAIYAVKGL